jgi:hypothetical protein
MRIAIGVLLLVAGALAQAENYGAPITMKDPITLEAAVAQLDAASTADVLIESKVDKVCKMEGCWLGLKSASSELHVTFKDHSFFVPQTLIGKTVLVQGRLSKVTQPSVRYELVASGVEVRS